MKRNKLSIVCRSILGLVFALSGLNHLVGFAPMPAMSGATALFWQGLEQTGYFFALLGVVEMGLGLMLLAGRWVPLALTVAAPIALNVFAFHAALAPQGMGVAVVLLALGGVLAWKKRAAFRAVLQPRAAAEGRGLRAGEVVFGLVFLASGVAGFLGKTPPPSTAGAATMMAGLAAAGYFMPLLSAVQVVVGTLLLCRRMVGLALLMAAPLVVQIVAYRLFVVSGAPPAMMVVAAALLAGEGWLCWQHRQMFAPLLGRPREVAMLMPEVASAV